MIYRRTLGVTVIAVLPLVAACGAGRQTTTDKERQTPYVASVSAGSLLVTAAALVPSQAASSGSASPSNTASPYTSASASPSASGSSSAGSGGSQTADAYLVFTVVNRGNRPDQLNGVQVQGGSVNPADSSASALTVAPSQSLQFVDPELGGTGNSLRVTGLSQPLSPGTSVPVVFQFQQAGTLTLQVPVRTSDDFGTTTTATPLPLTGSYPSASETPKPEPTGG